MHQGSTEEGTEAHQGHIWGVLGESWGEKRVHQRGPRASAGDVHIRGLLGQSRGLSGGPWGVHHKVQNRLTAGVLGRTRGCKATSLWV